MVVVTVAAAAAAAAAAWRFVFFEQHPNQTILLHAQQCSSWWCFDRHRGDTHLLFPPLPLLSLLLLLLLLVLLLLVLLLLELVLQLLERCGGSCGSLGLFDCLGLGPGELGFHSIDFVGEAVDGLIFVTYLALVFLEAFAGHGQEALEFYELGLHGVDLLLLRRRRAGRRRRRRRGLLLLWLCWLGGWRRGRGGRLECRALV